MASRRVIRSRTPKNFKPFPEPEFEPIENPNKKSTAKKPYKFVVPVRPIPKGRPRLGRGGRVFTPITTQAAENRIKFLYLGPKFEGPVSIKVVFTDTQTEVVISPYPEGATKLRGDIDNYLKLLMDGLNGKAWADDKQVHYVEVVKQ